MPVAADIPTDDSRDPSVPFAADFPDRFPDPHGRTHRITVPAPAPARREAHFTAGELEQQGLVAPVNDPHRFFDADLRADATLKINDKDQREHEIAAMLLERYGTRLRSVAPVNIQGRATPDSIHSASGTTIELKRNNSAMENAVVRQITQEGYSGVVLKTWSVKVVGDGLLGSPPGASGGRARRERPVQSSGAARAAAGAVPAPCPCFASITHLAWWDGVSHAVTSPGPRARHLTLEHVT